MSRRNEALAWGGVVLAIAIVLAIYLLTPRPVF